MFFLYFSLFIDFQSYIPIQYVYCDFHIQTLALLILVICSLCSICYVLFIYRFTVIIHSVSFSFYYWATHSSNRLFVFLLSCVEHENKVAEFDNLE